MRYDVIPDDVQARLDALLERVTVLEQALEEIDRWANAGTPYFYALEEIQRIIKKAQ